METNSSYIWDKVKRDFTVETPFLGLTKLIIKLFFGILRLAELTKRSEIIGAINHTEVIKFNNPLTHCQKN